VNHWPFTLPARERVGDVLGCLTDWHAGPWWSYRRKNVGRHIDRETFMDQGIRLRGKRPRWPWVTASPAEAWERLVAAGLLPTEWAGGMPWRLFSSCPDCDDAPEKDGIGPGFRLEPSPERPSGFLSSTCARCKGNGLCTYDIPETMALLVALAGDAQALPTVAELAREVVERAFEKHCERVRFAPIHSRSRWQAEASARPKGTPIGPHASLLLDMGATGYSISGLFAASGVAMVLVPLMPPVADSGL
jgi:hypothetical protein